MILTDRSNAIRFSDLNYHHLHQMTYFGVGALKQLFEHSNVCNMSGRVVSDIQTGAESEKLSNFIDLLAK